MEGATLTLSLLILAGLYWLHRWALAQAYAAGRADEQAERARREQHGLAALPVQEE